MKQPARYEFLADRTSIRLILLILIIFGIVALFVAGFRIGAEQASFEQQELIP